MNDSWILIFLLTMNESIKLVSLFLLFYAVLCSERTERTQFLIEDILPVNNTEINENHHNSTKKPVGEKSENSSRKEFETNDVDVDEILEIWNPKSVAHFWNLRTPENLNITKLCEDNVSVYLTGVLNGENWALKSKLILTFLDFKITFLNFQF